MKRRIFARSMLIALIFANASPPLSSQIARPEPLTLALRCAGGDCPLLTGVPQTAGMRSGYVRLKPGKSVGWHTTGTNEESLVVVSGQGVALLEGLPAHAFSAPALVYIPPTTKHNVTNSGKAVLEYVYVVAPAQRSQ